MHCPQCGSSYLKIGLVFSGDVCCAFTDDEEFELLDTVSLDSHWSDESPCACLDCAWSGVVRETRPASLVPTPGRAGKDRFVPLGRDGMTPERLKTLKDELAARPCHPVWRAHLEDLIAEVERLSALVETLTRVVEAEASQEAGPHDTVLG